MQSKTQIEQAKFLSKCFSFFDTLYIYYSLLHSNMACWDRDKSRDAEKNLKFCFIFGLSGAHSDNGYEEKTGRKRS